MADTTITSTAVKSVTTRQIHAGVYALYATYTSTTTPSASEVFLMLPIQSGVTVIGGWVGATFTGGSFSMDLMAGFVDNKSLFLAATEFITNKVQWFNQGLPHTVTLTDSDSFPLVKALAVTIAVAASGTIVTTPVYRVMALLQSDSGNGV